MNELVGKRIDRYQVIELLGEGGMASVYKAFDTRLERYVAIKVIRSAAQAPEFTARFEREARALAQLTHPNIVHVLDTGDFEGKPYIVMEYLAGGTLRERMGRPLPVRESVKLILPVAEALRHAHERKIIHRDVKPANILLTQSGAPMLSDFGVAKVLETTQVAELTKTGTGVGTPEYMAPEQGLGKPVDAAHGYLCPGGCSVRTDHRYQAVCCRYTHGCDDETHHRASAKSALVRARSARHCRAGAGQSTGQKPG